MQRVPLRQTVAPAREVQAELAEAIRTGNIIGSGESSLTLRELNPQRYGAAPLRLRR
jgi:hypothetical protein